VSAEEKQIRKSLFVQKVVSNALGKDINAWEYTYIIENFPLEVQKALKIVDSDEVGELVFAEISVNSSLMIPEITFKGPDLSANGVINNWNFQTLLAKGRGMTPGDVQTTIVGQTQDKTCVPVPNAFYIQRYKDDTLTDYLGNSERVITGVYSGPLPRPYNHLAIYVKNTTTDSTKTIHSVQVNRTVYETPGQTKFVDIKPGEQVIVDLEGEEAQISFEADTIDLGELVPPSSEDPLVSEPVVANVAYNVSYDVNPLNKKTKPGPANYVISY
jgi:hypothetical protein